MLKHLNNLMGKMFGKSVKNPIRPIKNARARSILQCEALEERSLMAVLGPISALPTLERVPTPPTPPASFTSFQVIDASRDDSPSTVFSGGALRVDYGLLANSTATVMLAPTGPGGTTPPPPPPSYVHHVSIEIYQGTTKLAELGSFTPMTVTSGLVNLAGVSLPGGTLSVKAHAYFTNGSQITSEARNLQFKTGQVVSGDFKAGTFDVSALSGDGIVIHGRGGTDVLALNELGSTIVSLNGASLSAYSPVAGGQAIYQGLAVDYLRLSNGREIYFTGIEKLEVLAAPPITRTVATVTAGPTYVKQTIDLMVTVNDADFNKQWNLHVTDVPDAWRFTKGSSQILLVSLDTGALPTTSGGGGITGINPARLISDVSDKDNGSAYGHGHQAISVMAATPNDSAFHAGINWFSKVYVTNVYSGVDLQDAIQCAFDFADEHGLKLVFQGGIQGESWLTNGGTQAELENLINTHTNRALFAIAAGNGGPGGNLTDPNFMTSVSGVAKLQTNHSNVMSVGALQRTSAGGANASQLNLASYSNRGSNLTMVAPTDSPATDFFGATIFTGTSCANPNMAAMASLVWSTNPNLTAPQVREILQSTAMDLGTAGRDNTFGSGLVDVGRACRRAVALARDPALANLVSVSIPQFPLGDVTSNSFVAAAPQISKAPAVGGLTATPPSGNDLRFTLPALANIVSAFPNGEPSRLGAIMPAQIDAVVAALAKPAPRLQGVVSPIKKGAACDEMHGALTEDEIRGFAGILKL
jgi:serine protease